MQLYKNSGFIFLLVAGLAITGCSSGSSGPAFNNTGGAGAAGSAGTAGTTGLGGATGTGGVAGQDGETECVGVDVACSPVICPDGNSYSCGDCSDNDGDGCADARDPECLGPCDDTEGPVLLTGTSGESNNGCGADCYFEGGAGSGSGDCTWDRQCDPLEPKNNCEYCGPESGNNCKGGSFDNICPEVQPFAESCEQGCGALTPNGCDCFGCCTFPQLNGGYVYLGSEIGSEGTCTLNDINDPELCRPCTPAVNCLNECGRCELCLGKTEIPADCFP